jgi:hypothetical protein
MPKTQAERAPGLSAAPSAPPLSATVRRHLGQNLRAHYADSLTAPVNQRLEALIAQLDKPRR